MSQAEQGRESYWDLLAEVARLQGEMGKDLGAWARAYEAGGRAFQGSARTLERVADLGRRMEQYLVQGPPASVRQALQAFANPLQAMGAAPGAGVADPFARFWEVWAAAMPGGSAAPPGGREGGA